MGEKKAWEVTTAEAGRGKRPESGGARLALGFCDGHSKGPSARNRWSDTDFSMWTALGAINSTTWLRGNRCHERDTATRGERERERDRWITFTTFVKVRVNIEL